ncbi:MAG: hypothetical protein BGP05_11890 [Rhizobiales bacterium 62-47]|nr:hypothetical protein [Hyphomicrobiales bacterium]OJY10995.1 MAG: hypothetical protein BGP05_11890 [Rhizobiales bacterium 62-47]
MSLSHSHTHTHGHSHSHVHGPGDGHAHGLAPHPAQDAPWSILRMSLVTRLGAAVAVSAVMWAIVLIAMRPS